MHIERSFRKLENVEEIRVYNVNKIDLFQEAPKVKDTELNIPFKNIMKHVVSDINVFEPTDDGDYIIVRLGWNILERGNVSLSDVEGRLLSQASPFYYEIIKEVLDDVLENKNTRTIRIYYYTNDEINNISNINVVFEEDSLFLISDYKEATANESRISDEEKKIEDQQKKVGLIEYFSQTGSYYKTRDEFSWSPGIYNIINRSKEETDNYYNIIFDLVIPEDRPLVEELLQTMSPETDTYENIIRIRTHDGQIKYLDTYLYSKFDENGDELSHYGLFKDVSVDTHKHMTRPVDFILNGFKHNRKIALLIEPLSRRFEFSQGFYDFIEIPKEEYKYSPTILENFDDDNIRVKIQKMIKREIDKFDETFVYNVHGDKNNQKIAELHIENFKYGNKTHSIGFLTDITEQTIRQKELEESNEDKNILIKEVHHRVKNNLQILNSFLNLEKRVYKNDPELIINHMQTRLNSLALLHEKTYNTEDFKNINIKDYIEDKDEQLKGLINVKDQINFISKIDSEINLSIEVITPLLLIIDEITMNSLKHAFTPDMEYKEIYKEIKSLDNYSCQLIIKDNGVGIKDPNKVIEQNLGWEIINNLTKQMDGDLEYLNLDKGMGFKITFPTSLEHTIDNE